MNQSTVYDCEVLPLSKIHNRAGNITIVEGNVNVPFSIRRIYYLYDIPGGESRGGHAHKELYQLIVAASGSFDVLLDDGVNKKVIKLNRPDYGLLVVPGIWRELFEFSSGSVCLVLASEKYDEDDYLREYDYFKTWKSEDNV
ncbi:MAG: FdtA/QdtA family cupin domain-containing protein [Bacteroidales bacterium]|nr:FdtA/QdtA family cupin domain-containing protein [Bacteroidales bacterium]